MDIQEVFDNITEINRIYDIFVSHGKTIIGNIKHNFDLIEKKPIEFIKDKQGNLNFTFLNKSFFISYIVPIVEKGTEKDKSTRGKIVSFLIMDKEKNENKIIDELTFEYDFYGKIYREGVEYYEIELIRKYITEFKKYILDKKSSFSVGFAI